VEGWVEVGPEDLLRDGEMQEVEVAGESRLLARVDGAYYAVQSRCPHMRGRLSKGQLDGAVLTCPVHGSTFNVTTGENIAWVAGLSGVVRAAVGAISSRKGLATFETQVKQGRVWVKA
jgi:nitrite reductase/ring-hydroxylating ferredoxin subunit